MAFSLPSYLKESVAELKKVAWPTRQEALRSTGIVVAFSVVIAAFLGLVDYLFTLGLNYLIDLA
ncbi:MAG: hypothetical protein ACD_43C00180G0002 [uncultured bacterium]|nr:MAG: hypothetical protein ACD_43C00180G0002 [uncultured bacterium]